MRFELANHVHDLTWEITHVINKQTGVVRFRFHCGCGMGGDTHEEVKAEVKKFAAQMREQRGWIVRWGRGSGGNFGPGGSNANWYVHAVISSVR